MSAISERTKKVIADTLGVNEAALTPETDLIKDLGADSLDVVELVSILETEFKVSIPDEKIERMKKVSHFIEYFETVRPIPDSYYYAMNAA